MYSLSFKSSWLRPEMALSLASFGLSIAAGVIFHTDFSGSVLGDFKQLAEQLTGLGIGGIMVIIFLNNALKALAAIVLGIALGIPSLFFLVFNGFTLGIVASSLVADYGLAFVLAALIPHGIIEIPLIILASGLGMNIGRLSFNWLIQRGGAVKPSMNSALGIYVRWILPGLAVAAVVETFVTPLIVAIISIKP
jgi:stage II sporulation protein M